MPFPDPKGGHNPSEVEENEPHPGGEKDQPDFVGDDPKDGDVPPLKL